MITMMPDMAKKETSGKKADTIDVQSRVNADTVDKLNAIRESILGKPSLSRIIAIACEQFAEREYPKVKGR